MDKKLPGEKLCRRALEIEEVRDRLFLLGIREEHQLLYLSICFDQLAVGILQAYRATGEELDPIECLIASIGLLEDGEFVLQETEDGNIIAVRGIKKL